MGAFMLMGAFDCLSPSACVPEGTPTAGCSRSAVGKAMPSTSEVRTVRWQGWVRAVAQSLASVAHLGPCSPAVRSRMAAGWAMAWAVASTRSRGNGRLRTASVIFGWITSASTTTEVTTGRSTSRAAVSHSWTSRSRWTALAWPSLLRVRHYNGPPICRFVPCALWAYGRYLDVRVTHERRPYRTF